jgi:hypothetical protein
MSKYNNEHADEENEHKNENSNNKKQKNKRVSKQVQFIPSPKKSNEIFLLQSKPLFGGYINIMMTSVTIGHKQQ